MVLKKVTTAELEQYQPYLLRFNDHWVTGRAFKVACCDWKFYDEFCDALTYYAAEMTEMYALPREIYNLPSDGSKPNGGNKWNANGAGKK